MPRRHREGHLTHRIGWLRAAVLGANDGVVSTASLIVGVAAANATHASVITAGFASLVAGAMSMAAGEYVSVSSQSDSEHAEVEVERRELETDSAGELRELTNIYVKRGLTHALAHDVAVQLTEHNALDAHLRDELGISATLRARPMQAAITSATPCLRRSAALLAALSSPLPAMIAVVSVVSLIVLTLPGGVAASWRRRHCRRRDPCWFGAFAMLVTAASANCSVPSPENAARYLLNLFRDRDRIIWPRYGRRRRTNRPAASRD
jgi:VIT1/CCC1 family predicted Fe2+/Mn2+ transporter